MENQLVVFDLADEHYGVNIATVESIIKLQSITAMPHAPSFVRGVTNLRGVVLPVIDLRKRFNLPAKDGTKDSRIVVVEINGAQVGMVVDAVTEVLSVSDEDIEAPPAIVTTVDGDRSGRSAFITGIAKVNGHHYARSAASQQDADAGLAQGRLIILLDLGQVLNAEERANLQALQQDSSDVPVEQDKVLGQTREFEKVLA